VTNSELIGKFAILVFGVGYEFLGSTIDDPIQILQRDLANNVWQRVGDLNNIESASAALDLK
jgi:hypothetical protein